MRAPAPRFLLILVVALFASVGASRAYADAKTEARTHYQAGQRLYAAGDYRGAITEFSAAQQLMPADLNSYNIALCYDKLGEAEPAIQYYREFLNKQPNNEKRAEIDASITRLEAALKSASAKRADEQRKEDARKAEDARRAEEAKRAAAAAEAQKRPPPPPVVAPDPNAGGGTIGPGTSVGSTGTPATGQTVTTGDSQLDRVSSIDVNGVRDRRVGGAGTGVAANTAGPAAAPPNAPNGQVAPPPGPQAPPDQPAKKPTPIYKKWWFWVVIGVSAFVVYSIATENSKSNTAREVSGTRPAAANDGGFTLLRF